jgi:hypothetical protein
LEALVSIGTLASFEFADDIVKIKRQPTPSQQRFLDDQQH